MSWKKSSPPKQEACLLAKQKHPKHSQTLKTYFMMCNKILKFILFHALLNYSIVTLMFCITNAFYH